MLLSQSAQKIKNIKKVKSILKIDDDLAKDMKDEIDGVSRGDDKGKTEASPDKIMVDSSLLDQVERLKKVFSSINPIS